MNIVGPPLCKVAIVPSDYPEWNMNQALAVFRPVNSVINKYLYWVLAEGTAIKGIVTVGTAGQENISLTQSRDLLLPMHPVEEQKVIVEKVNQLLANCDVLEREIKASKTNAEKLIQSVLIELLGDENNVLFNKTITKKVKEIPLREVKYNSKTLFMDLVKLLQNNGKLHAEDLWRMSEHYDKNNESKSIDDFYTELKKQIEEDKTIKEVENEKGYLELV